MPGAGAGSRPGSRLENCSTPVGSIELWTDKAADARLPELGGLLADAVRNGASVGFVTPLADGEIESYRRRVGADLAANRLRPERNDDWSSRGKVF